MYETSAGAAPVMGGGSGSLGTTGGGALRGTAGYERDGRVLDLGSSRAWPGISAGDSYASSRTFVPYETARGVAAYGASTTRASDGTRYSCRDGGGRVVGSGGAGRRRGHTVVIGGAGAGASWCSGVGARGSSEAGAGSVTGCQTSGSSRGVGRGSTMCKPNALVSWSLGGAIHDEDTDTSLSLGSSDDSLVWEEPTSVASCAHAAYTSEFSGDVAPWSASTGGSWVIGASSGHGDSAREAGARGSSTWVSAADSDLAGAGSTLAASGSLGATGCVSVSSNVTVRGEGVAQGGGEPRTMWIVCNGGE